MIPLGIKIQTYEEGQRKVNELDFDQTKEVRRAVISEACIRERGMQSGKTSVAFKVVDQDGNQYFAELSGALVEALNSALQGANARFLGV